MDNTTTCLLLKSPRDTHGGTKAIERRGRWLQMCVFTRDDLRSTESIGERVIHLMDADRNWTHLAVIVSDMTRRHDHDRAAEHEDAAFQDLIEQARLQNTAVKIFGVGTDEASLSAFTRCSADAWAILKNVVSQFEYFRMRDAVLSVSERSRPPFPVIRELGRTRYFAATSLIWYKGRKAVFKGFRYGFEHHFASERSGLQNGMMLGIAPDILEIGPHWVVVEYLERYRPLGTGPGGLISRRTCIRAFEALRQLHDAGFAHFDFNPANVLAGPNGNIRLIDFEHVLPYKGSSLPFEWAPVFSAQRFFEKGDIDLEDGDGRLREKFMSEGPKATYTVNWEPRVGLPYSKLTCPTMRDELRRALHVARLAVRKSPSKIGRAIALNGN